MSMTGSANELNRGYFDDISELKQHGGKVLTEMAHMMIYSDIFFSPVKFYHVEEIAVCMF
ncbi:Shaker-related potassium channel tsha2 [Gossypium arboreum]|uniref:Shaker-related potassium channel tsha2 n=1 Tax=Gossypium arboreum TaxID=29729 RepID=A0A0B0NHK0_GOSAR|nr:Shaker-related potassium channel tsha2 [Gossypium arboreum]